MSVNPQIPTGSAFATRLAIFYATLFVALGVQLPFLPVWLFAKGLDSGAIGIVLAIPMVVRVLAIPVVTRAADRRDALRAAIVLAAMAAVLGYGAVGLAQGIIAITTTFVLASACHAPVIPLTDAYAVRGLSGRGRAYGPVRLWGSVAFVAGSFGAGVLLDVMAAGDLIWLVVGAMVLSAAAALALAPLGERAVAAPTAAASRRTLLRDPAFLAVVLAASLIQASHAVYYGFSAIAWQRSGLDGGAIGALWALGVVAEIALFGMSARLPFGPIALLLLGAAGAFIRWSAMALDPPAALLPILQCLHALSFGATYLGALGFIARTAPAQFGATAQGYLAVASGVAMATTTGVSGLIYARWGDLAYGAMAITAAAGGAVAFVSARRLG